MLGVDRLDQRMLYYQFSRKSVRWWRKVGFFWLLKVAVVNAYILYNVYTADQRKLTHKKFRRELVLALCEQQHLSVRHQSPAQQVDQSLERLRGSHYLDTAPVGRDSRVWRRYIC